MYLNGSRLPIKSFQEYVDLYLGPKDAGTARVYERFNDRWEVCVSMTDGQFQQVWVGVVWWFVVGVVWWVVVSVVWWVGCGECGVVGGLW